LEEFLTKGGEKGGERRGFRGFTPQRRTGRTGERDKEFSKEGKGD